MPIAHVHRLSAGAPDDVAPFRQAIARREIEPTAIVAILAKTEGNGNVNDFSRAFAVRAFHDALGQYLPEPAVARICLVMSGGTEGGLAPHWTVIERREGSAGPSPALAVGSARTEPLPPEALGRMAQVEMVAAGVRAAMAEAGIADPADVHFVQVKCPLLTTERITEASTRGARVVTRDTLKSMGFSRGASALGVGVALQEFSLAEIDEAAICCDFSIWSGRASTSAGIELRNHEIVVLGMSKEWSGPLAIDHAVMADALDLEPVRAALARLGLAGPGQLPAGARERLVALLAKADAASGGTIRGFRHTMLNDSDISSTRHVRAFVGGALAGLVGHGELFVSGGGEHQGPDGGGPVALIVSRG